LVLIVALLLFDTEVSKTFPCTCVAVVSALESDEAFLVLHWSVMEVVSERSEKVSKQLPKFSLLVSISDEKRKEMILRCAPLLTSSIEKTGTNFFKTDKFDHSGSASWWPSKLMRKPCSMKSKPGKKSNAHLSKNSRCKRAKTDDRVCDALKPSKRCYAAQQASKAIIESTIEVCSTNASIALSKRQNLSTPPGEGAMFLIDALRDMQRSHNVQNNSMLPEWKI
jgi:hypothetical protein